MVEDPTSMPSELNNQQLETLHSNGYLSLPDFISPGEAARIRNMILDLFERRAGVEEGAYGELIAREDEPIPNSPQIRCPVDFAPELHRSACFQSALHLARQILGTKAHFFTEVAILKRSKTGAATPWHQDEAFRDPHFAYHEITVWVALQDVDEESGCLTFVPGSHSIRVLAHHAAGNNVDSLALECGERVNTQAAVTCPIPAGGCTVHFPRTLHCSTPNRSERDRLGYALTFGITPRSKKTSDLRPWLEERIPELSAQRRKWMQGGGFVVAGWRRLRRGELRGWQTLQYWMHRAIRTLRQGG